MNRTAVTPRRYTCASVVAASCALALLLSPALRAEDALRLVSVTGEAEMQVAPDMALLTGEIIRDGQDAASARREADAIAAQVVRLLTDAGIAADDIDSTAVTVSPRYRWNDERKEQQLLGYRVSRGITARILELADLGPVLVSLSDAGVNRLSPPRLTLQDEESVYRETLSAAVMNAKDRASAMAAVLGEDIDAVHSISQRGQSQPRPMMAERAMMAASDAAPAAESYQAGDITYRVTVDASFSLK